MNNIYVIAGTAEQFKTFSKKKAQDLWNLGETDVTLSHFIYVDRKERLMGVRNPSGFFIGTWKDHPNIESIMVTLAGAVSNDFAKSKLIKELWVEMRS